MAYQIRISPDALRVAAKRQHEVGDAVMHTYAMMDEVRELLAESWEGIASNQAMAALEEIRVAARKVSDGVREDAGKLEDIASAFEAVDVQAPIAIIRKLPTGFIGVPIRPELILIQPGTVRIVPEAVREAASRARKAAEVAFDAREHFQAILNSLRDDWEGKACNRYIDESAEIPAALAEVGEALVEFSERLNIAARRYEELDNSL